ncbi:MAG: M28 family peptidase [Gemmatimonadota bacterium]|nr:M28 family peptidase [Gemmatimonadota bacterium]MDP6801902.1 M28 family peptidase [Gemmatimonadota bacterium]MDP7031628.1 M28 family peptidase [Gemmatimonadota bacterium]
MRSTRFAAGGLLALHLVSFVPGAHGEPLPEAFDLYSADRVAEETIAAFGRAPGAWRVLHREAVEDAWWLLLALPPGLEAGSLPSGSRPNFLASVGPGERVVYAHAETPGHPRLRTGRAVAVTPSGGAVQITREDPARLAGRSSHGFRILNRGRQPVPVSRPGPNTAWAATVNRALSVDASADLRTGAQVETLRNSVEPVRLEAHVRELAELESGAPSSRYWAEPGTENIARLYIGQELENSLGSGSVTTHRFEITADNTTLTVSNVIGTWPSATPNAGAVLVTAHYDAIGLRSDAVELCETARTVPVPGCDCDAGADAILANPHCSWNWRYDAAPGADDNASGISCLLECARILAAGNVAFDFDLLFVAFQGEELGLLGSAAFADSLAAEGTPVHAVLNMDMVGFNALTNRLDVVANEGSEWLADYIIDTAQQFVPELQATKNVAFFARSDHASFWSAGMDAILLTEDMEIPYPQYHTFMDTWENTFPASGRPNSELQLKLSAQLLVSGLARMALHYDQPDLAIPAGEVEVMLPAGVEYFEAGDTVPITARVHNFGASTLSYQGTDTDTLSVRVSFFEGDPQAGGMLLGDVEHLGFFPAGGAVPMTFDWQTLPGDEGVHTFYAQLEGLDAGYASSEISLLNNSHSTEYFLRAQEGTGPRLLSFHVYPNPAFSGRDELRFRYDLTLDAEVRIVVHSLAGEPVGRFTAGDLFTGNGNQAGPNNVEGSAFRWHGEMESGIYVYTIRALDSSGTITDQASGKFALVR